MSNSSKSLDGVEAAGALAFPPGATYPQALTEIYMAGLTGKAPEGVELTDALPDGKVVIVPAEADGKVVVDLRAPFAYRPDLPGRRIRPASLAFPAGLSPADISRLGRGAGPWPRGALVGIPILPPCMMLRSRDDAASPRCGPGDVPLEDLRILRGPPLP